MNREVKPRVRNDETKRYVKGFTDIFYFSRLKEPADIKYFRDICGDEYLQTVQTLKKYSFLEVHENNKISVIYTSENEIKKIDSL
ncbi:MAG: hypothetical protein LBB59_05800 [Campylobacteraceae bacterium]|jgi:hypothetical protein|nr:hypothetical protein [Campylobacteraceae bacterium]